MEPRYASKTRYFLLTSPLRRQNMPKMRENPKKMGLTAKFSRFSEHFSDLQTLRAGKQPRISTMGSNLRPTTCRLCTPYRSLHTYLVQSVGRGLTPDVRITESALKITKRATSGKLSTGNAHKTALCLEKPLFSLYNPSTATKRTRNARKIEESGPYGPVFAISRTFFRTIDLTGRKTAKISNNRFQATTHKLSHCDGLRTLQSFIVGHGLLHTAVGRA